MTAQKSDDLINDHPRVDFGKLRLYGILDSDGLRPAELPAAPDRPVGKGFRTDLRRGYIAVFRLADDGTLTLESYLLPFAEPGSRRQTIENGQLKGDFWLDMRRKFLAPHTYIPFRDGCIVEAEDEWKQTKQHWVPR